MKRVFEVTEKEQIFHNKWMSLYKMNTSTDGVKGEYFSVKRPDCVAVVATDAQNEVTFLKQFRYPTEEFSVEVPIGGIDDGEQPEDAAIREFFEETGICLKGVSREGWFYALPGLTDQKVYVFSASIGKMKPQITLADEITDTFLLSKSKIEQSIKEGVIHDSISLLSLYLALGSKFS